MSWWRHLLLKKELEESAILNYLNVFHFAENSYTLQIEVF